MIKLLALIPIIHFLTIYYISYRHNRLHLLRGNYGILYLDWIFLPFNLLIPIGVTFSWIIFAPAIIVTSIGTTILHFKWKNMKNKPAETAYFANKKGFSPEGYIHLVFMSIQSAIVFTVFISRAISSYYVILLALLLTYLVAYLIIIMLVRKVRLRSKIESPFIIIGIILLIIRIIILYVPLIKILFNSILIFQKIY